MLDGRELREQTLKVCKLEKQAFDLSVKPIRYSDGYVCPICNNRRVYMIIFERNGLFYTGIGNCKCGNSEDNSQQMVS